MPAMFVMPEKYRGGAQPMAQPKPPAPPPPTKVIAPPPPPKPPAPTGKPVPKRKAGPNKALIIAGVLLILGLGIGAYFITRPQVSEPTQPAPRPVPAPEPIPQPAPEPPPEPEPAPEPTPSTAVPGADTDGDGLSDLEENLIYVSDPNRPDTDADGYVDGLEVENRYNPAAVAPRTLFEAGVVKAYDGGTYSFLFPVGWANTADSGFIGDFSAMTGERVSVAGPDVLQMPPDATVFTTKNGLTAHRSSDGRTVSVDLDATTTLVFAYDLGIKGTVDYAKTFEMMINSVMGK